MWQNPESALPETVAAFSVRLLWPAAAAWRPELLLAALGWLRGRLVQLAGKLYMAAVLLSSWTAAKETSRGRVLLGKDTDGGRLLWTDCAYLPAVTGILG